MTERNLFCYSEKFNDESSFQQQRWRAFNQVVGETRYHEILRLVKDIIPNKDNLKLNDFWSSITQGQWQQLLSIQEAKDFKKGFEFISDQKIEDIEPLTIEDRLDGIEKQLKLKKWRS